MIKKSEIIFWSTMFFVVSWLIGFVIGIKTMFIAWTIWLAIFIYIKFLEMFD